MEPAHISSADLIPSRPVCGCAFGFSYARRMLTALRHKAAVWQVTQFVYPHHTYLLGVDLQLPLAIKRIFIATGCSAETRCAWCSLQQHKRACVVVAVEWHAELRDIR